VPAPPSGDDVLLVQLAIIRSSKTEPQEGEKSLGVAVGEVDGALVVAEGDGAGAVAVDAIGLRRVVLVDDAEALV